MILIVCGVVVVVFLGLYLFKISNIAKVLPEKPPVKVSVPKKPIPADAPELYVRYDGEKAYTPVKITKSPFVIGSESSRADLKLKGETVEAKQAKIIKVNEGTETYYELVNYAKLNRTEFLNKSRRCYENMGEKEGIELEGTMTFYIGSAKLKIVSRKTDHKITATDRVDINSVSKNCREYTDDEGNQIVHSVKRTASDRFCQFDSDC